MFTADLELLLYPKTEEVARISKIQGQGFRLLRFALALKPNESGIRMECYEGGPAKLLVPLSTPESLRYPRFLLLVCAFEIPRDLAMLNFGNSQGPGFSGSCRSVSSIRRSTMDHQCASAVGWTWSRGRRALSFGLAPPQKYCGLGFRASGGTIAIRKDSNAIFVIACGHY